MGTRAPLRTLDADASTPLDRPSSIEVRHPLEHVLQLTIAELDLAHRWTREHGVESGGGGGGGGPLARWQGKVIGREADADATGRQVGALWGMIAAPSTKAGRFARQHFANALLEYCERTSRPLDHDEVDWTLAQELAAVLARIASAERAVLVTLGRYCTSSTRWVEAARVVADAHAPPALRAAWDLSAGPGAPGRPRRDPLRPPPDTERAAWGAPLLEHVVGTWELARRART